MTHRQTLLGFGLLALVPVTSSVARADSPDKRQRKAEPAHRATAEAGAYFDYLGHKVWYRESGQGEPMVFLHNGGNDHRIWDKQVEHFSKAHRVFTLDHLGFGNSDCPNVDYDLPLFTGEVTAFIDQLDLAPVTLVGHCIGGAMAINFTMKNPEKVKHLVVLNVATRKTAFDGPLNAICTRFSADRHALEQAIAQVEKDGLSQEQTMSMLRNQYGDEGCQKPEFADHMHKLWNSPGQMRALYNNLSLLGSFSAIDEFVKPNGFPPCLLFWGKANKVLLARDGEGVRERLQPDQSHFIEGVGHMMMREKHGKINQIIEHFLREHP